MNAKIIDAVAALTRGAAITYIRFDGMTCHVTSAGFLVDDVDLWRDGASAPTYQGRIDPSGPGRWRARTANGKATGKTDLLRVRADDVSYEDALAGLLAHESRRPAHRPWDCAGAAAALDLTTTDSANYVDELTERWIEVEMNEDEFYQLVDDLGLSGGQLGRFKGTGHERRPIMLSPDSLTSDAAYEYALHFIRRRHLAYTENREAAYRPVVRVSTGGLPGDKPRP